MNINFEINDVLYLKIVYKDNNDVNHCMKLAARNFYTDYIYASYKYEDEVKIPYPQEVELSLIAKNGIYKAKCTLKSIEKDEPYLIFKIMTPQETDFQQNREFFRVNLCKNAQLIFKNEYEDVKKYDCITCDISANGVSLILEQKIHIPENVRIILSFENKELKERAKFIRYDEEEDVIKASFNFINITDADRDFLSHICLKKQMEDKRDALL